MSFVGGLPSILKSNTTKRANIDVANLELTGGTGSNLDISNGSKLRFENSALAFDKSLFASESDSNILCLENSASGGQIDLACDSIQIRPLTNDLNSRLFSIRNQAQDTEYIYYDQVNDFLNINSSLRMADGKYLKLDAGSNIQSQSGQVNLINGVSLNLISGAIISGNERIFLQRSAVGASTSLGELVYNIPMAGEFVIESRNTTSPGTIQTGDQSTIQYFIVIDNSS